MAIPATTLITLAQNGANLSVDGAACPAITLIALADITAAKGTHLTVRNAGSAPAVTLIAVSKKLGSALTIAD